MTPSYQQRALTFKAFCDENRLMILDLLRSGEKCACSLLEELQISQSTLSHHMKILCTSNIVISRREGKWTYYTINIDGIDNAKVLLSEFSDATQNSECHCK
jgi:ArsR family transcriptional regulator